MAASNHVSGKTIAPTRTRMPPRNAAVPAVSDGGVSPRVIRETHRDGASTRSRAGCATAMTNSAPPSHLVAGFHSRGSLPHLKREGATYFVTFRLAGTLPHTLIESSKHEREAILRHALAAKRPLTWHEQKELFRWYSERVDRYLDCGHGLCHLRSPACAKVVSEALVHFIGERYELHAWVVMPNHAHAVVWPRPPHTLSEILHTWKSFSAHEINKVLPRKVQHLWQRESYDHLIENDDDLHHCVQYTLMNPVTANLSAEPHEWPWSSASVAQPSPAAS